MKVTRIVLVTVFALLAIALLAVFAFGLNSDQDTVHSNPRISNKDGTSTNWAGYAVLTNLASPQSGSVSEVNGSWVVPSANCSATPSAYSSFWIGIDGYSSGTVEQAGTDSDCSSGSPRYYAWYEMYPKFPVNLNMKVAPGDLMSADVKYLGNGNFQLTIVDKTTGASFSTVQKSARAVRSSAEWIAEAPSSSKKPLQLADFGAVFFTSAQATLNGHSGAINDPAWKYDAIIMEYSNGTIKANPSGLSSNGTAFSITWSHS